MKDLRHELQLLRWPLLWFACALLLALAIGMSCWQIVKKSGAETNAVRLESLRMQTDARRLTSEEQEMRIKINEYQAIAARGIIGPERRLDWVELVRNTQRDRQLLGLDYEIQPQTTLSKSNGGHAFMSSVMRVQLPLLHEEDLLRFVGDLQAHAPAFVRVRSCRISRGGGQPADVNSLPALLQADCQLDWITLKAETGDKK